VEQDSKVEIIQVKELGIKKKQDKSNGASLSLPPQQSKLIVILESVCLSQQNRKT
jgi:hypothetical protein